MKSNNKMYSFFILLALIFWNPFCFYFIYKDTPVLKIKVIVFIFWFVFISGIFLIYLLSLNKLKDKLKNYILSLTFLGILTAVLILMDVLVGLISPIEKSKGLIFVPNSKAHYQTIEFDFSADINSSGLRDREIEIKKSDQYRILCFGDSWTFGWGVNIENSWPRKLEQYLKFRGYKNIEVINCGQGDQYTRTYKNYMEKIVPLLKPDLVLVGVLQLDDLAQLYENNYSISDKVHTTFALKILRIGKTFLKHSFKNILIAVKSQRSRPIEVKSVWHTAAITMINRFSKLQKIHFSTLPGYVQSLFENGDLNPSLIRYYVDFPDRNIIFNNPSHPATRFAMIEMNKDFKEMKNVCQKNNSEIIFVNLPTSVFIGHRVIGSPSDVLMSYFMTNNKIDSIYSSIAKNNGIPYMELTKYFIALEDKNGYFFRYDGHPNAKGYEEIADYIGQQLILRNELIFFWLNCGMEK